MFDTFDRTGVAEFPFPRDVVFKAVQRAAEQVKGMKVQDASPSGGFLNIKTGVSAMSWGENVKVSVLSSGPWSAQVQIGSAGKTVLGSATTHGKNQKNVSALIHATADFLNRYGETWAKEMGLSRPVASSPTGPPISVADEIRKLADLRDKGLLSDHEFAEQKARLLNP